MAAVEIPETGTASQAKEAESTSASKLPWMWIVDYLSRVPQISNSLLFDLIESSPEPIEDTSTTEAMALRCLEELVGYSPTRATISEVPTDATSHDQVDMSSSCIDTLEKVVKMKLISNSERKKFVHARRDLLPYLRSKRASLPKSSLQRVKFFAYLHFRDSKVFLMQLKQLRDDFHIPDTEESNPTTNENGRNAENLCFDTIGEGDSVPPQQNEPEKHETANQFTPPSDEQQTLREPRTVENNNLNIEDGSGEDTSTECDGYLFEKVDVAMEKECFLSSRGDEYGYCIICKEAGNLLICSSIGCPLKMHEECLTSSPEYHNDSFYCPFCACTMIFSELHCLHRKACVAWRDLRRFKAGVTCPRKRQAIPPDDRSLPVDEQVMEKGNSSRENNASSRKSSRKNCRKRLSPTIPQLKRKRIPWTAEEEIMLREGVKKFSVSGDSIPWTVILEYGSSAFGKKRNTIDLKDKWRNICKKNNKSL